MQEKWKEQTIYSLPTLRLDNLSRFPCVMPQEAPYTLFHLYRFAAEF